MARRSVVRGRVETAGSAAAEGVGEAVEVVVVVTAGREREALESLPEEGKGGGGMRGRLGCAGDSDLARPMVVGDGEST